MGIWKKFVQFLKWLILPVILDRATRPGAVPINADLLPVPGGETRFLFLHGKGEFRHEIVRTSHYQPELKTIAGNGDGPRRKHECIATLDLDEDHANSRGDVVVTIDDIVIGSCPRTLTTQFREWLKRWHLSHAMVKCSAVIVMVADRSGTNGPNYRVKIDIELPFRMTVE